MSFVKGEYGSLENASKCRKVLKRELCRSTCDLLQPPWAREVARFIVKRSLLRHTAIAVATLLFAHNGIDNRMMFGMIIMPDYESLNANVKDLHVLDRKASAH